MAKDFLHLVPDAALPLKLRKLDLARIQHRLVAVDPPQVDLLNNPSFNVAEQVIPGTLVLALASGKGDHFALPVGSDTNEGQDWHLLTLATVDDAEAGAVGEDIEVVFGQGTALPGRKLGLKGMKDPRDDRGAGAEAGKVLHNSANLLAEAAHKHLAHQLVDLRHKASVELEELGVKATEDARDVDCNPCYRLSRRLDTAGEPNLHETACQRGQKNTALRYHRFNLRMEVQRSSVKVGDITQCALVLRDTRRNDSGGQSRLS